MTGPAALGTELVPIDQLIEHPENYNKGDDEKLAELLTRYGQWRPAVVQRSTGHVLIGNTMLRAARDRLGWTTLNVHYRDVDDDDARRILAGDNRARDFSTSDDRALAELLRTIGGDTGDLSGTLWELDDFDDLLASIEEQDPGADEPTVLFPHSGQAGAYGEGGEAEGTNVRQTPSYADYQAGYASRASRFLALMYPLAQYAWVVENAAKLSADRGLESNSALLLALISEAVGEEPPAVDATISAEAVAAAEALAEQSTEEAPPQ